MARLRTFIAAPLGKQIRDRCAALQEGFANSGVSAKWVEHENLHVSLLFLGEVDDRDVPRLCREVAAVCAEQPAFAMTVEGVGCFPNPRRPRVFWAGVSDGTDELVALHDALEPPLLALGCYRREERQYTPHVTLGRSRSDGGEGVAAALARAHDWHGGTVEVREIHVLSSQLTPQGPIYAVLSRAKLKPAARRQAEEEE
jgi:2'-5' RNA ligase